jgi:hypothetical protein
LLNPDPDQDFHNKVFKNLHLKFFSSENRHMFSKTPQRTFRLFKSDVSSIYPFFFWGGGGVQFACLDPDPPTKPQFGPEKGFHFNATKLVGSEWMVI